MRAIRDFDPADATENEPFGFDFSTQLEPGETITDVVSFTINMVYGTDPDYLTRLGSPPSYDGTVVANWVSGLQPNCKYRLAATVFTSLSKTLTLWADVAGEVES